MSGEPSPGTDGDTGRPIGTGRWVARLSPCRWSGANKRCADKRWSGSSRRGLRYFRHDLRRSHRLSGELGRLGLQQTRLGYVISGMRETRQQTPPTLDVVVAMRDGRHHLPGLIMGMAAQAAAPSNVIVVDDGSTDGSVDYLRREVPSWVICSTDSVGPAGARNAGARASQAEWLLFLDVDDIPRPDWCAHFRRAANDSAKLLRRGVVLSTPTSSRALQPETNVTGCFLVGSWAIHRSLWDQVQGYDPRFRYSENTDLAFRLRLVMENIHATLPGAEVILDGYGVDIVQAESARARNSRHAQARRAAALLLLRKHKAMLAPADRRVVCRVAFSADLRSGRYHRLPADALRLLRYARKDR